MPCLTILHQHKQNYLLFKDLQLLSPKRTDSHLTSLFPQGGLQLLPNSTNQHFHSTKSYSISFRAWLESLPPGVNLEPSEESTLSIKEPTWDLCWGQVNCQIVTGTYFLNTFSYPYWDFSALHSPSPALPRGSVGEAQDEQRNCLRRGHGLSQEPLPVPHGTPIGSFLAHTILKWCVVYFHTPLPK